MLGGVNFSNEPTSNLLKLFIDRISNLLNRLSHDFRCCFVFCVICFVYVYCFVFHPCFVIYSVNYFYFLRIFLIYLFLLRLFTILFILVNDTLYSIRLFFFLVFIEFVLYILCCFIFILCCIYVLFCFIIIRFNIKCDIFSLRMLCPTFGNGRCDVIYVCILYVLSFILLSLKSRTVS